MTTNKPGRPVAKKAAPAQKVLTPENAPEVPEGPAPGAAPVETPEQKEIRELKMMVQALQSQMQPTNTSIAAEPEDKEGDVILLHFVEDGFTSLGKSWYIGQELEFVVGEGSWENTLDRNGDSWVSMSEEDQYDRWGKIYFRRGPWRGKTYKDAVWEKDAPPESELERADRVERNRRRAAPVLPQDLSAE